MTWLKQAIMESPFFSATFVDWLDIALLSVVVYRVLLLIRGTRAMQVLIGLALLGGLYLFAELAGLSATHWVLDSLFVYMVLALLILFQEDIRRALARAGGTVAARVGMDSTDAQSLQEVVKTVFSLAPKKIGALIVLERHARLDPWCEGAQQVDAGVSTELLQAIFHPTSPLHDGAVVIRKNRVVAAGVFLPITLSGGHSSSVGTRHRAALGISEQTDCLCLVVSEERGTVGLVRRGELTPIVDANDLRKKMLELMVRDQSEDEREASDVD
jgi:diadenylate cyclase